LPENLERFYGKPGCFGQLNKVKSGILPNPQAFGGGSIQDQNGKNLFFSQVPFANLGLWKHSFAKTAKLWVKLQNMNPSKKNKPTGLRGATQSARS